MSGPSEAHLMQPTAAEESQRLETHATPIVSCARAAFSYPSSGFALGPATFSVRAGEVLGIVGPNGSGKTTLLRLLSGFLEPKAGQVLLDGQPIASLPPKTIAKSLAFVAHQLPSTFPYRAIEIVLMGRMPHLALLRAEKEHDEAVARRAMAATDTLHLAERYFNELSGGERQRVMIAMALAQEPRVLLLDEPTSHLDISHVTAIFDLLSSLSHNKRLAVAAVLHDLNLASEYCDRLLLLSSGQIKALGKPRDVLSARNIQQVFETTVTITPSPITGSPLVFVLPKKHR